MLADINSLLVNPMFLRHDLLIELGRLEIALGNARLQQPASNQNALAALESRRATLEHTLERLSA